MSYKTINKSCFKVLYSDNFIQNEALIDLINGQLAAVVVKKYINNIICDKITDNFINYQNSRDKNDNVPGNFIGAYHYNKHLDKYFDEVKNSQKEIKLLFSKTTNPIYNLQEKLKTVFNKFGLNFRIAKYKDSEAGKVVARKWTDTGTYSLKPHDDIAQLTSKLQTNFEIQKVSDYNIIGVNLCVCNSIIGNGGELVIWNCITDNEERKQLGIAETGYPYPMEYLHDFAKLSIKIEKGDLYFVNSNLIHAVNNEKDNQRLTISFLMGKIDNENIIYWT